MKLTKKLETLLKVIEECRETYKNWYLGILDCLKILKNREVVYKLRNGVHLKATLGSFDRSIIEEIWKDKTYTPLGFEIKKYDTVIDIGAHKGFFSIFAGIQAKRGVVYSFEPSPNFKILLENIKLNNLHNIYAYNCGVCGKEKSATLYLSGDSATYTIFPRNTNKQIKINLLPLKKIFVENKIEKCDFLKIDCEGAEYDILLNTPKNILNKIEKISLELHLIPGKKANDVKNYLINNKFKIFEKPVKPPDGVKYPGIKMLYCYKEK